ncbi:hypothetical protein OG474_09680 [Kribbella sp. NBC_01505]|uniref:hypothetical protein n=1 Tax=Kribbella sp. NBC_01505 TaxID=2903580 RepID=UPI0038684963
MSKFEDMKPNDHTSLLRRLEDLERQVQQAQAARRLEAATIGRGGITIKGGAIILQDVDGREIARMGIREDIPHDPDGNPQPGFILRRNDGSLAFALDDPNPNDGSYRQLLKMQDAQGNVIFSEDTISGWGLATPTHSLPMYPSFDPVVWPGTTTSTAGVWAGLWLNYMPLWNPILEIGISTFAEAATTGGRVRVSLNSIQVGSDIVVASNTFVDQNFTVNVPTFAPFTPGQVVQVLIEGRQNSATAGKVKACPSWIYGSGSYGIL